jgi:competence protein ComEC
MERLASFPADARPRHPLVILLAAVATGIVAGRYVPLEVRHWVALAIAFLLAWLVLWRRCDRPLSASSSLLLAVALAMAAWERTQWHLYPADELGRCALDRALPVCVEATALVFPQWVPAPRPTPLRTIPAGDQSRLRVRVTAVRDGPRWRPASGVADLLVEGHLLGVDPGDRLRIFAQLRSASSPENPGQRDFAWYDRGDRQLCQLRAVFPDCVTVVERYQGWNPLYRLQQLRGSCDRMLWRYLSHERSGLAAAVLLGARERLERDRMEAFFHTGTIHILAISGLHVGILAAGFLWLGRSRLFPPRQVWVTVMVLTIAYAALTEARAPVVRAAILVVIVCAGWLLHRRPLPFNTLAAAAILVLLLRPADLFRAGPQLSFLAVAALVWFRDWLTPPPRVDPLEILIAASRPWPVRMARALAGGVGRMALASFVIWLVALPLVMYCFHLVTPLAVLLNVALSIPIATALFSGLGVLVFGWLCPPLATLLALVCDVSLTVLERSVQYVEVLPGSHYWVAAPPLGCVLAAYGALGLRAVIGGGPLPRRWCLALTGAWIAAPLAAITWQTLERPRTLEGRLECAFLAVGHGAAVVVQLPHGQTLLYDAGRMGTPEPGVESISAYLWSQGISHLDAVILSHADADHYNALPQLLGRFSVGVVYVPPDMFARPTPSLVCLREAIRRQAIPLRQLARSDRLAVPREVVIATLHPPRDGAGGSDNANSIVLDIQFAGRRLLLPGDLEPPGIELLMAEPPVDCDVILAPHHGSPHSSPAEFLRWCTPEWIVVSSDRRHQRGELQEIIREAGGQMLHTGEDGAVEVSLHAQGVDVRSWRGPR